MNGEAPGRRPLDDDILAVFQADWLFRPGLDICGWESGEVQQRVPSFAGRSPLRSVVQWHRSDSSAMEPARLHRQGRKCRSRLSFLRRTRKQKQNATLGATPHPVNSPQPLSIHQSKSVSHLPPREHQAATCQMSGSEGPNATAPASGRLFQVRQGDRPISRPRRERGRPISTCVARGVRLPEKDAAYPSQSSAP